MRLARPIAERAGIRFSGRSKSLTEWITENDCSLVAAGIGGAITGRPADIIVVDDPIKDWTEAQSVSIRETAHSWLRSSVISRVNKNTSIVVVQTRWHEDDVSGRLSRDGWNRVNLKAIKDDGTVLWPEQRPLELLLEQKSSAGVGEFIFSAMYQGEPRPRGNALFGPATYYEAAPDVARYSIGVDLAYTAKSSADYSVAVVLAQDWKGTHYVVDYVRQQVKAPDFAMSLRALAARYPGAPMRWYCSGTEQGSADFIIRQGIPLQVAPIKGDKFVRAQALSNAWNEGKVLVPRLPWANDLIGELSIFTGLGDLHDDIVDALAAAYDGMPSLNHNTVEHGNKKRETAGLKHWF